MYQKKRRITPQYLQPEGWNRFIGAAYCDICSGLFGTELKGAAHRNICRKLFGLELKGASHRNIIILIY